MCVKREASRLYGIQTSGIRGLIEFNSEWQERPFCLHRAVTVVVIYVVSAKFLQNLYGQEPPAAACHIRMTKYDKVMY